MHGMNKAWQDATKRGDLEKVRLLLEQGVDINAKDQHGQTALMTAGHAAHIGHVDIVPKAKRAYVALLSEWDAVNTR